MKQKFFLIAIAFFLVVGSAVAELAVDSDFPGGSGTVQSIDQEKRIIIIDPEDHPRHGWRCWWYVKITGLEPGKSVELDVGEAPWATPKQATYSEDEGKTWHHTDAGVPEGKRIRYVLAFDSTTALVAWGPPFVPSDAEALVRDIAARSPDASVFSLCRTREDRNTPALRISSSEGSERPLIWVQARQHAWESGASWVGKGFAEWIVSDAEEAVRLRERAEIVFVPIMDIDNVFRGAGGKSQEPQDHNRDWSDAPHWKAVAAAQARIGAAAAEGRLAAFIDLHNPSAGDLFPYYYIPPRDIMSEEARANLDTFIEISKKQITGPLRFAGKVIESGPKYDPKAWQFISKNWVAKLGTPAVSVTLETAWNTPASTTEGYQAVGRQLGVVLESLLAGGSE